jgi:single stranded DNA-binding protein
MANSNNVVILKGHLGAAPKIVDMNNGKRVANLFLATNRRDYKDADGNWQKRAPQWHNVSVFLPRSIDAVAAMSKGDGIEVRASIEQREYTDKGTGEVRKTVEILVNDRFEGHLVKAWSPAPSKAAE